MTIENDIRLSRLDKTKEAATHANEELDWPNLNKYREDNENPYIQLAMYRSD